MSGYAPLNPPPPRLGARTPTDTDPVLLDFTEVLGAYQVVTAAAVANGGTGYADGNTLLGPDGSNFTVEAAAGVVTAVTIANPGICLAWSVPANPQAVTGGAGSGAALNLTWGAADTIASITGITVSRADGIATGAGDLTISASAISGAGLQVMAMPAGGFAEVDYLIACTVVRASGPTITRTALQLVVSSLG